jgi:hypothetical protein
MLARHRDGVGDAAGACIGTDEDRLGAAWLVEVRLLYRPLTCRRVLSVMS